MRQQRALGCLLSINAEEINNEHEELSKVGGAFSMGDSTYRFDGFSIGQDYLRFEGRTVSRGELIPTSIRMEELIGEGAFSKVYKGVWTKKTQYPYCEEKHVAIKEFCLLGASQQRRNMLLKELRTLCKLGCDSLVKLEGAFLHDDAVTMVLEYMGRGSLQQWIHHPEKVLLEPAIASITFQMLCGLSYLHQERIIHRDIKPANVLVHFDGSVKLCDFGLASLSDKSLQTTVVGTTRYMAPERLRARPYGRTSDIWSLGLVVLECLSGKIPWEQTDSLVSLLVTVEETHLTNHLPDSLPIEVREFLCGCLQHQPEKRIPADILLKSPWFYNRHQISNLCEAKYKVKKSIV